MNWPQATVDIATGLFAVLVLYIVMVKAKYPIKSNRKFSMKYACVEFSTIKQYAEKALEGAGE